MRIGFYRYPKEGEKGWKPIGGMKVETEEGESGITNDKWGYVDIPVYTKQPFEIITITVKGHKRDVPTFGDKEGIKGGWGSLQAAPNGQIYISTNTCPDVYKLLKKQYGLNTVSGNPPTPQGECRYPD